MRADDGAPTAFGKDAGPDRDTYSSDDHDAASETSEKQAGVKRIEAVSKSWTKMSLVIAYVTWVSFSIAHRNRH
jgi:SP family sugar:H+ symporter-like MFS transporter